MTRPLPLQLADVAAVTGGRLDPTGPAAIIGFSIDSRKVRAFEVFIALEGQRTNGHRYVADAAARGAACAVVNATAQVAAPRGFPLIRVDDTALALRRLGSWFRSHWPLRVVGITGSAGKTTTKEFTAELLSGHWKVFRSEASYNNLTGLPLTLTRRRPEHQLAVLEMGMSTPGELSLLSRLVRPDLAALTNIGHAHQQNFLDIHAIAAAKAEILDGVPAGGLFVANADDARVMAIAERFSGQVVTFGFGEDADVRASAVEPSGPESMRFVLGSGGRTTEATLGAAGRHQVANALAALAVASALGIEPLGLAPALAKLRAGVGRGRLLSLGQDIVLQDDAYNANPEALVAAAETLPASARRVAVVGDMRELGGLADEAHDQAGQRLAALGYGLVVGVGELGARIARAAGGRGVAEVHEFASADEAAKEVPALVRGGDAVLVKGSRAVGLEVVVKALLDTYGVR